MVGKLVRYAGSKLRRDGYEDNLMDDYLETCIPDERVFMFDNIEDEDLRRDLLEDCQRHLNDYEYTVMYLRFITGLTYVEIGKRFGLSKERVRQKLFGSRNNKGLQQSCIASKLKRKIGSKYENVMYN